MNNVAGTASTGRGLAQKLVFFVLVSYVRESSVPIPQVILADRDRATYYISQSGSELRGGKNTFCELHTLSMEVQYCISVRRSDREKTFFLLIRSRWGITAPVLNAQKTAKFFLASIGGPNLGTRLSQNNHRTTKLLERSRWMGHGIQLMEIKKGQGSRRRR
jgi:hypothetical protein